MGAIKEGDDPSDYKYEWNPKIAVPVGLAGGTLVAVASLTLFLGALYGFYYTVEDIGRKEFAKQRKPLFGKKKKPLYGKKKKPLFGGRKR